MVSINNLTVSFGGFTLLNDINFHVSERDCIGLVGKNGAGKSTLLKIIMGIQKPTSGQILRPAELKIGYLPQQMEHRKDVTVFEEALTAFASLFELKREMEEIGNMMAERIDYDTPEYHKLIVRFNDLNDRIHYMSDENPEGAVERTLIGLGFRREELGRLTGTFSQGWNMRIELAKILLKKPNLLLLDEPTNHLDIESIGWLEDYLAIYSGSLVLISHDRRFLDNVTNRTVELMLGKAYDYKVPYSRYLELREERVEQQRAAFDNQQRMIEKSEEFIERFRYKATKSNQVQSRIKQLEKIDRIEMEPEDHSKLTVKFPPAPRSGQVVVKCTELKMQYDKKVIFDKVNLTIEKGDKVAFVGRNGEGKTTMMKIIVNELVPKGGEMVLGHNVSLGYYAQNQEDLLNKEDTVFDTLDRIAVGDIRTKLRDILGAFLFKGEDADKKVAVLSGGERSRLAMAKLMLKPHNLLALDEPTNHMDIRSKDVLKQALMKYDGTLLLVSHDRDFLDGLVDKVYEFKDGKVREYLGGVMDFLQRKKLEHLNELETREKGAKGEFTDMKPKEVLSFQEQKELEKEQRKRRNAIERCEKAIEETENKIKQLELSLSQPKDSHILESELKEYNSLKSLLEQQMEEWERLQY